MNAIAPNNNKRAREYRESPITERHFLLDVLLPNERIYRLSKESTWETKYIHDSMQFPNGTITCVFAEGTISKHVATKIQYAHLP